MKSINAKRIAAVAASVLMGLAFAGQGGVTWNNVPIINNQGQPVVQVVVGSTAQPSDGVVAANIAAVIGNLAFTTTPVTASANTAGVSCVVTNPTCALSNQQVWFNVKGFSGPSGSYAFSALIGSVLNGAVQLGTPTSTKYLSSSTAYTYPESTSLQISPAASAFTPYGSVPTNQTPTLSNSGGWRPFASTNAVSSFTNNTHDNVLQVTNSQLPILLNNWGSYSESESLWLSGFPVFNQGTGSNTAPNFAILSAGGAYQVLFNKPIAEPYTDLGGTQHNRGTNAINNAAIEFLGKNWTILNYTTPTTSVATTATVHTGSKLSLAASLTPTETIYVGHNITSGNFSVELTDLGQPNQSGNSQAAVQVFYAGTLTNVTQLAPKTTTKFTVGSHNVYVNVNQTFAGLYAYQKWAKMKLYSNVVNITDSAALNNTNAKGWTAFILWTNGTTSGFPNMLQSIIAVNVTPRTLWPGSSYGFVTPNWTAYSVNFVGDTLGNNYDPVTFSTSSSSNIGIIQNLGAQLPTNGLGVTNMSSQPGMLLTVSSGIPSAFSYAGQVGKTVTYDLTPYALNELANTVSLNAASSTTGFGVNVVLQNTLGDSNVINTQGPVTVFVNGYTCSTNCETGGTVTPVRQSVQFTSLGNGIQTLAIGGGVVYYNVTNIYMSRPLPNMAVYVVANVAGAPFNSVLGSAATVFPQNTLAKLSTQTPAFLYQLNNVYYQSLTPVTGNQVTYNQQNGQPAVSSGFVLTPTATINPNSVSKQYFTYNVMEYDVPGSTSYQDQLSFGLYNNSATGASNYAFEVNESATGSKNNLTYFASVNTANAINAPAGFVSERGSKYLSPSASSLTINMAKVPDTLQFVVTPTGLAKNFSTKSQVGPVGIGQAVPGFANLTVSNVTALCNGGTSTTKSCSVTGLANVIATPSVSAAVVPVSLNTASNPIAVLDSGANQSATLIVVGSKFVNSVAGQIFAQQSQLNSTFAPGSVVLSQEGQNRILVAGYSAAETVQAGNQFINQLLAAASTP